MQVELHTGFELGSLILQRLDLTTTPWLHTRWKLFQCGKTFLSLTRPVQQTRQIPPRQIEFGSSADNLKPRQLPPLSSPRYIQKRAISKKQDPRYLENCYSLSRNLARKPRQKTGSEEPRYFKQRVLGE